MWWNDLDSQNIPWISLHTGRKIFLEQLFQYRTYAGVLTGFPNAEINRSFIQRAIQYATQKIWIPTEPYLLEPEVRAIPLPAEIRAQLWYEPQKLPDVVCLAQFHSPQPTSGSDEAYSFLTVVWFQDQFALPIDASIKERLASIDWDTYASNGTD